MFAARMNFYQGASGGGGGNVTFTQRTLSANLGWSSLDYGNGVFVAAAGDAGTVPLSRSTDGGNTWANVTPPFATSAVAYANGVFIIGNRGIGVTDFATSTNGSTWTTRTSDTGLAWITITPLNNRFYGISSGTLYSSDDNGNTWANRTDIGGGQELSLAANGSIVIASVNGDTPLNKIKRSTDGGNTWANISVTANNTLGVAYGSGRFVITETGAGANRYYTSTDGIAWFSSTFPFSITGQTQLVRYAAGSFVIPTSSGDLLTSPDGTTWSKTTVDANVNWDRVAYGSTNWVAVGFSSNAALTFTVN